MQYYAVPRGQFILERYFERKFLYPFNVVLVIIAIIAVVRMDWVTLGICLVACFLNALIATRLPKNRSKSFSQLAQGSAADSEPADVGCAARQLYFNCVAKAQSIAPELQGSRR